MNFTHRKYLPLIMTFFFFDVSYNDFVLEKLYKNKHSDCGCGRKLIYVTINRDRGRLW